MDSYAFEAGITRMVPIGLVPEGLRLDAHYQGRITEGPLAGDSVGVVDVRQVFSSASGSAVTREVHGYLTSPALMPPLEAVVDPAFAWPDVKMQVHGAVTLRTAAPDLQALNSTVYGFTGTIKAARGELRIRAQSLARVLVA